jgi:hypothetical protein
VVAAIVAAFLPDVVTVKVGQANRCAVLGQQGKLLEVLWRRVAHNVLEHGPFFLLQVCGRLQPLCLYVDYCET